MRTHASMHFEDREFWCMLISELRAGMQPLYIAEAFGNDKATMQIYTMIAQVYQAAMCLRVRQTACALKQSCASLPADQCALLARLSSTAVAPDVANRQGQHTQSAGREASEQASCKNDQVGGRSHTCSHFSRP